MVTNARATARPVNGDISGANPGANQPTLGSPIQIQGEDVELPSTNPTTAGGQNCTCEHPKIISPSVQGLPTFDSKLRVLEQMLLLRQKMDPDTPKNFDDIIRTEINTLAPTFWAMESRESAFMRYLERLADIRKHIFSQWKPMDHNSWNGDRDHSATRIEKIMKELLRVLDIRTESTLIRDLDPLIALDALAIIKDKLFDKHGLEKSIDILTSQKIRALSLAQHSQLVAAEKQARFVRAMKEDANKVTVDGGEGREWAPRNIPFVEHVKIVNFLNHTRAEALRRHNGAVNKAAALEVQIADLKSDLQHAKTHQADPNQHQHTNNSNANPWSTPIASSAPVVPTSLAPNTLMPDAPCHPVEVGGSAVPAADIEHANSATSSCTQENPHNIPAGPHQAEPSGLFGSPDLVHLGNAFYGENGVHDGQESGVSSPLLSFNNTTPTPISPQMAAAPSKPPMRGYGEQLRGRREATRDDANYPPSPTRANHGSRRRHRAHKPRARADGRVFRD